MLMEGTQQKAPGGDAFPKPAVNVVAGARCGSSSLPNATAAVAPAAPTPIARCHACGVPTAIATALAQLDAKQVGSAGTASTTWPHDAQGNAPSQDAPLQAAFRAWKGKLSKALMHATLMNAFTVIEVGGIWLLNKGVGFAYSA